MPTCGPRDQAVDDRYAVFPRKRLQGDTPTTAAGVLCGAWDTTARRKNCDAGMRYCSSRGLGQDSEEHAEDRGSAGGLVEGSGK
eukprot:333442-Hanusia_phi.AAC.2